MRSMARTVGEFGIPEDAAHSNHEAEEHLGEVMRRRREEIAAGAEADRPDVISQILLAGAEGCPRRGRAGSGWPTWSCPRPPTHPPRCSPTASRCWTSSPPCRATCATTPTMVKNFVEETLRYDGPAKNLCRQTTAEVTIAGVTIPADSRVMVLMGSANRDERVFPRPDTFDLFRTFTGDNKILTFGEGIHSCMGAPIARLHGPGRGRGARRRPGRHRGPRRRHPASAGPSRWSAASPS